MRINNESAPPTLLKKRLALKIPSLKIWETNNNV